MSRSNGLADFLVFGSMRMVSGRQEISSVFSNMNDLLLLYFVLIEIIKKGTLDIGMQSFCIPAQKLLRLRKHGCSQRHRQTDQSARRPRLA